MIYSTTFAGTESPLSQGGLWKHTAPSWKTPRLVNGIACTDSPNVNYDDSFAYVLGFGPDQTVTCTVVADPTMGTCAHEIAILLRLTDGNDFAQGYQVDLPIDGSNFTATPVVARWNGALGDFTVLPGTGGPVTVATGDLFKASMIGNLISVYYKQVTDASPVLLFTQVDNTFAAGSPGMGFFRRPVSLGGCDDAFNESAGVTTFLADDGLGGAVLMPRSIF